LIQSTAAADAAASAAEVSASGGGAVPLTLECIQLAQSFDPNLPVFGAVCDGPRLKRPGLIYYGLPSGIPLDLDLFFTQVLLQAHSLFKASPDTKARESKRKADNCGFVRCILFAIEHHTKHNLLIDLST